MVPFSPYVLRVTGTRRCLLLDTTSWCLLIGCRKLRKLRYPGALIDSGVTAGRQQQLVSLLKYIRMLCEYVEFNASILVHTGPYA